jgi:hypothetical protein
VKLCPRHHPNPRNAEVCAQCGNLELSTPQPKVSIGWRFLEWVARILLGAFLVVLSGGIVIALLNGLLQSRDGQAGLFILGFLFAILWWLWSKLPDWFRKLVRRSFEQRRRSDER